MALGDHLHRRCLLHRGRDAARGRPGRRDRARLGSRGRLSEPRQTFDEVAELYERARPGYPDELFDDLIALAGLAAGGDVLEVGCGTGQATRSLAARGLRVHCIELGPRLVEVARRTLADFRNVTIENAAFEEWEPGERRFDLVFSATAWHWIDPPIRYTAAARALRPGGALAVVSGRHVVPEGGDPFFAEIQRAYAAVGEPTMVHPRPDDVDALQEQIEASGLFDHLATRRYVTENVYGADAFIELLETTSHHRLLPAWKRERLYAEQRSLIESRPERSIRYHRVVILDVARVRPRV